MYEAARCPGGFAVHHVQVEIPEIRATRRCPLGASPWLSSRIITEQAIPGQSQLPRTFAGSSLFRARSPARRALLVSQRNHGFERAQLEEQEHRQQASRRGYAEHRKVIVGHQGSRHELCTPGHQIGHAKPRRTRPTDLTTLAPSMPVSATSSPEAATNPEKARL
jgi:hypothetical protein